MSRFVHTIATKLAQNSHQIVTIGCFNLTLLGVLSVAWHHLSSTQEKMKSFKILAMGTMALAVATLASAATTVKITGSTAFRKGTIQAILHTLKPGYTAAADGTDLTGITRLVISGTINNANSDAVIIQCAFAGSVGGVNVLDNGLTLMPGTDAVPAPGLSFNAATTWLKSSLATNAVTLGGTTAAPTITIGAALTTGQLGDSSNFDGAATADIAMSDSFQTSTDFNINALTDDIVGVVTFAWTKGVNNNTGDAALTAAYGRLTNITTQQAQALLTNGYVPASMLTGNSADRGIMVVATGRNNDSGTRLTAFAESGFGISVAPNQYSVAPSTGALTVFGATDGYASSSQVKSILTTATAAATSKLSITNPVTHVTTAYPYIIVSYVGTGTVTSQQLTYNGATFSNAAVQDGGYNFWGYEHLLRSPSCAGVADTFATALVTQLTTSDDATANGVRYSTMKVSRSGDGALIGSTLSL